jgi:hypothetical protein
VNGSPEAFTRYIQALRDCTDPSGIAAIVEAYDDGEFEEDE